MKPILNQICRFRIQIIVSILAFTSFHCKSQDYFTYASDSLGVQYTYSGLGDCAGVSLVDMNGDGLDDLTIPTALGEGLRVYTQGEDTLVQMFNLAFFQENHASRSITWADYDNDGDKDMLVTNLSSLDATGGPLKLYRNDGGGTFTDVSVSSGFNLGEIRAYSACWADYDNDGWLDCYVSHRYTVGSSYNRLMRNLGNGSFVDVAELLGVADEDGLTYASIFFDYDLDGDADLYTANDKALTKNRFFRNEGDGTFTDISISSGIGIPMDGMGLNVGDYDNNGWLDLYVTNTHFGAVDLNGGNRLFSNFEGEFIAPENDTIVEVNAECWGTNFIDVDNDMDLDLYVASTGNGLWGQNRILFINETAGDWTEYSGTDLDSTIYGIGFGSAIGDVNNDGYYDIVMQDKNLGEVEIWQNVGGINHWVKFHLEGTVSNRDAIGTLIEVWAGGQKQIHYTTSGSSFASQNSDTKIFGLGANELVDSVILHFPSGIVNVLYDLPADRKYSIVENQLNTVISCLPFFDFTPMVISDMEVALSGTGDSDITSWIYNMGDGGDFIGQNGSYSYQTGGVYDICLTAENSCSWDSICHSVVLDCFLPEADFSYQENELLIAFSDMSQNADSVHWFFGDGITSSLSNPTHEFESSGVYQVCVEAFNSCGSMIQCDSIEVTCIEPLSTFSSAINELEVSLSADDMQADSVLWTLGDGTALMGQSVNYEYVLEGDYQICMTVFNSCSSVTSCDSISVSCIYPMPLFSSTADSLVVNFLNLSQDGDNAVWEYGDGGTSTSWQEQYEYEEEGTYLVCLSISNDCGTVQYCDSVSVNDFVDGLESVSGLSAIKIYPVPANEEVNVEIEILMASRLFLFLIDEQGKTVMRQSWVPGTIQKTLDVSLLPAGVYQLLIMDELNGSHTEAIVIQR